MQRHSLHVGHFLEELNIYNVSYIEWKFILQAMLYSSYYLRPEPWIELARCETEISRRLPIPEVSPSILLQHFHHSNLYRFALEVTHLDLIFRWAYFPIRNNPANWPYWIKVFNIARGTTLWSMRSWEFKSCVIHLKSSWTSGGWYLKLR